MVSTSRTLRYRVVCYTAAWIDLIVPYALNLIGLIVASVNGRWLLKELYQYGYYPLALAVVLATVFDWTPRARRDTFGEGVERALVLRGHLDGGADAGHQLGRLAAGQVHGFAAAAAGACAIERVPDLDGGIFPAGLLSKAAAYPAALRRGGGGRRLEKVDSDRWIVDKSNVRTPNEGEKIPAASASRPSVVLL